MRLTVLGCSGSVPGPDGPASSYLLEQEGYHLLLDLGNGAFGALQRDVDPADVDAVVLSHLHPDHCLDLAPYVVWRRFAGRAPLPRLPVLGPAGTHDRLAVAYDPGAKAGLHDVLDVTAVTPAERELGPFRLRFARVNHPVPTYAVRVEAGGRTLTYSGDTGVSEALVRLATGREAGEHAAKADVGLLLVTHVPPWEDRDAIAVEAAAAFGGPSEAVTGGTSYEL